MPRPPPRRLRRLHRSRLRPPARPPLSSMARRGRLPGLPRAPAPTLSLQQTRRPLRPFRPKKEPLMADLSFDRFKTIVVSQLGVEPDQVTPEASFVEDLNADSLDLVELIMAFEEEYKMQISDDDAEKIGTVGQAWEYIQEKVGESATL